MAHYLGLSTDALLRKELTVHELYSLDILKGAFDPTQLPPVLGKSSNFEQQSDPTSHTDTGSGAPGLPYISKALRLEKTPQENKRQGTGF